MTHTFESAAFSFAEKIEMKPKLPLETLILTLRGQKVILDTDLAQLYDIPTKALNQAIKRNIERFPKDFLFRLTEKERNDVVTNCDHLTRLKFSPNLPLAFTEHGAIMAATVLNSPEAVKMSLFLVRAFIQMREHLSTNITVLKRLAEIDKTLLQHDTALRDLYQKLLPLLRPTLPPAPRRKIGYHQH